MNSPKKPRAHRSKHLFRNNLGAKAIIAVEENQRKFVEEWDDYKRTGIAVIGATLNDLTHKFRVTVYEVPMDRVLTGIPGGFWVFLKENGYDFWKRTNTFKG